MPILPTSPKLPDLRPESFKWLFMGGSGIGKSSLLAALYLWLKQQENLPNLIVDPDNGCAALPGYISQVRNWPDCITLLKELQRLNNIQEQYSWICLDLLNVIYEFCYNFECNRMNIVYPSDLEGGKARGKGWAIITKTFISWLRDMGNLGLPLIGTCHTNLIEISVKSRTFQRAVVSFPGGSATSAFQKIKESFDIVGYMSFDTMNVDSEKDLRKVVTANTELLDLPKHQQVEFTNTRVIYFWASQYWDTQDNSHQLPEKVVLPENWEEDWSTIQEAWKEGKDEKC